MLYNRVSTMTSENGDAALQDVTNRLTKAQIDEGRETERAKTREAGWVDPVDFDYEKLNSKPVNVAEDVVAQQQPIWASQARKYLFSDEYGDVGPRDEGLEQELFRAEHILKKGKDYDKYWRAMLQRDTHANLCA